MLSQLAMQDVQPPPPPENKEPEKGGGAKGKKLTQRVGEPHLAARS